MLRSIGRAALPVLACVLLVQTAHADIYTWVDARGVVNVSNLGPPEGARVTSVTHETPQAVASRNDAAREAARQAEVQALADRVRQLETEVQIARRPVVAAPAPVTYVPVPTPIIMPLEPEPAPPARGCDPSWFGCWAWGSGWFPSVIVVPSGNIHSHHFEPGHRTHQRPVQPISPGMTRTRGP